LAQLLLQDIERRPESAATVPTGGAAIKVGTSPDRVVSVHDPEMRCGHKSKAHRFAGHKAAVAVDPQSQLVTAVQVLPGNAYDSDQALGLVEQSEQNAAVEVQESIGDCAYSDGVTRQAFAQAGRKLIAAVPKRYNGSCFAKTDFQIDLQSQTCRCPADKECHTLKHKGRMKDRSGAIHPRRVFEFDAATCAACHLRSSCVKAGPGKGRSVSLHPHEDLMQQAREFQQSEGYAQYRRLRQVAEHRLARLMQLGVRKARYFGRQKTEFQLLMAATVANLTLAGAKTGQMRTAKALCSSLLSMLARFHSAIQALVHSPSRPAARLEWTCRPDF